MRIPGHEVVGTIARLGSGCDRLSTLGSACLSPPIWAAGTAASASPGNNNLCANYQAIGVTLDGGFAEYMRVPAAAVRQGNVMPVSRQVDPAWPR